MEFKEGNLSREINPKILDLKKYTVIEKIILKDKIRIKLKASYIKRTRKGVDEITRRKTDKIRSVIIRRIISLVGMSVLEDKKYKRKKSTPIPLGRTEPIKCERD